MAPSFRLRPGPPTAVRHALVALLVAVAGACASSAPDSQSDPTTPAEPASSTSGAGGAGLTAGGATGSAGGGAGPGGTGAGTAQSSNAEVASIEFVSTAVAGGDASGYLAPDAIDDPALGAPYTPAYLTPRLADLSGLVDGRPDVRPSTSAHPGSAIGPACAEGAGRAASVCDIEVFDGSGRLRATVAVHWADSGVTDFVIVEPSGTGAPGGVGRAVCSPGFTLLVGGHTIAKFDVAICAGAGGAVEYNGVSRETGDGITIAACAAGPDTYEATNNDFGYTVSGAVGPQRGRLTVLDPSGATVVDTTFTPYRTTPTGPLDPC